MLCNKRASVNCPPLGGSSPLSQLSKGASKLAGKQGCRCSAIPESSPRSVRLSQDAALTVSSCLSAATDGHADALLQHLPDGVLDHCIARRKSAR